VHIDVPGYLSAISEGRFTDALEIVLQRNPLPSVCGRICLHPCEEGCRRCQLDAPVSIAALKRAAADHGVYPQPLKALPRGGAIAVVGSGPAGLTAAHDLANLGFSVTIIEAKERLGGMLRYGIPNYRLPDYALDRDIDYILGRGVEVRAGVRVGTDVTLDELAAEFDAVLVTAGLQGSRPLPLEGTHLPQVYAALPFLEAAADGRGLPVGRSALVVGGGNVAMDVARTAVRLGATRVETICLESREEMPASAWEIHEAEMEGVRVNCSWGPVCVLGQDNVTGLTAKRCMSVFDASKRFAPVFDEDAVKLFDVDTVIFATGQGPDVADLGLTLTPRGAIVVDPLTLRTERERVYAAGDVVSGPTRVIDAIAAGQRAAAAIWRDITGDPSRLEELDEENAVLGKVPHEMGSKIETRRRIEMETLEFYDAMKTFDEVEFGYTEYEAAREAQRCLSCTTGARLSAEKCAACLTCMRVCPHGAPSVEVGGYLYFDADACHACGACASECPAGAIQLEGCNAVELTRRVDRALYNPDLDTTLAFVCGYTPDLLERIGQDARIVSVTCLLRVSERAVLEAFSHGAHRIVFSGCNAEMCRFPHAMELVAARTARIRTMLGELDMSDAFVVTGEERGDAS
jgi:NADPH-dependent glutamate synthase beta subunit-like oxidoreductase